jgi:hypothetical protein
MYLSALRFWTMNHTEAVQEMAAERYFLEELSPDQRDAFEEHLFDCPKCALDVRSCAAFLDETRIQLPAMATEDVKPRQGSWQAGKPTRFFSWWRPVFAVPAFAALLLVTSYQNLVTLPALRTAANQPHIVPVAPLYGATRGGARAIIKADRTQGISLPVDLSADSDAGKFVSYSFELDDPQGKAAWTGTMTASSQNASGDSQVSIVIPGGLLKSGAFSLVVSGIKANGDRTELERYVFDIEFSN